MTMPLRLEALQASDGDCLLLHYDVGNEPRLILIDGGPSGVYANVLKKRLDQIRGDSFSLDLRLVMVSHIDADHITGILQLCKDLVERQSDGEKPKYRIRSLWHNSFEKLAGGRTAAVESGLAFRVALMLIDSAIEDWSKITSVGRLRLGLF
jgi:glyoxylase-like metal-dependent hydrolase (beta-lactamase superfamily II)